jgi:hypothetical protein
LLIKRLENDIFYVTKILTNKKNLKRIKHTSKS